MVTSLERASRMDLFLEGTGTAWVDPGKYEAKVTRFERLGTRLFGVANCLLSFGNLLERFDRSDQSMIVIEASFCEQLGFSEHIRVLNNLNFEEGYSNHPSVAGEPHIVFCAQHPIFDSNDECVGNIYLIDYEEREFDDESRLIFADLAVMVERELLMGTLKVQQMEMLKQIRNLKRDALMDPVLGMWNRGAIIRSLGIELERCNKAEKPVSLLFVSINQFQSIKEKSGGTTADALLLKVASRMRSCIRPFDALGRFDSDVFLIVLPGASNLVVTAVAERIRLAIIARPENLEDEQISLEVNIGAVSTSLFPNVTPEIFICFAEKALIAARQLDNNQIVQASPDQVDFSI